MCDTRPVVIVAVAIHECALASDDVGDALDGAPLSLPLAEADGDRLVHPLIDQMIASSAVATVIAAIDRSRARFTSINH